MPSIIDRGRGPEIEGTRITVYDIMDYYKLRNVQADTEMRSAIAGASNTNRSPVRGAAPT